MVVGLAIGLIAGLNIIDSIELEPPNTDVLLAVAIGLVLLWYLKHSLEPHSVIHVSPKRITIRNMSWSSIRKRVIPLEKLRHINVVNLWGEVRSLEFVTEDNRIMLHGNYGEAQHLREMILKILTKPTIVIHEKD